MNAATVYDISLRVAKCSCRIIVIVSTSLLQSAEDEPQRLELNESDYDEDESIKEPAQRRERPQS